MSRSVRFAIAWRAASASLAALTVLTGCAGSAQEGYVAGGVFPESIRTVAVHIFQNDTYDRGVEFELADALVKEIEARTPYKVVPASRADSILTGRIRSVKRDLLSRSPQTGLSEEVMFIVTADYSWRDLRSDRVVLERQSFSGSGLFVPSRPTSEPIELGQTAAVVHLARGIVETMQAQW